MAGANEIGWIGCAGGAYGVLSTEIKIASLLAGEFQKLRKI